MEKSSKSINRINEYDEKHDIKQKSSVSLIKLCCRLKLTFKKWCVHIYEEHFIINTTVMGVINHVYAVQVVI